MKRNDLSYRCMRAAHWPVIEPDEVERSRGELDEAYVILP
jgi:hypothetical protein